MYGVSLDPSDYVLHHLNGDHFDNNIDNLVLLSETEHKRIHHRDINKYAIYTYARNVLHLDNKRPLTPGDFVPLDIGAYLMCYQDVIRKTTERKDTLKNGIIFMRDLF